MKCTGFGFAVRRTQFLFFQIVNDFAILVERFAAFDCLLTPNFSQLGALHATFVTRFLSRFEKSVKVDAEREIRELGIARVRPIYTHFILKSAISSMISSTTAFGHGSAIFSYVSKRRQVTALISCSELEMSSKQECFGRIFSE